MSAKRVLSHRERLFSFAVLLSLALFLPVGVRYVDHQYPSGEHELGLQIEFIPPFWIQLNQGEWNVAIFVSAIGILIPLFLIIHLLLVYQVLRISRGDKEPSSINPYLVAVLLISLIGFMPTFQPGWGNVPLPLMIPVGLVFAKLLAAPTIDNPFAE